MLSDREKTDARRFMGYPVFGSALAGNMGWQFYQAAGLLEYRLTNLSTDEEAILRQYLTTLNTLEQSIPDAAVALDTAAAGVWTRNPLEMRERTRLFDDWRRRLCAFLGVPSGPQFPDGTSISMVV